MVAAATVRDEIKGRFECHDSRISLTLDCWTSSSRWEFMGMFSLTCSMTFLFISCIEDHYHTTIPHVA